MDDQGIAQNLYKIREAIVMLKPYWLESSVNELMG